MFSEVIEHNVQALQVLLLCLQKDYHVVQIDKAVCQVQIPRQFCINL